MKKCNGYAIRARELDQNLAKKIAMKPLLLSRAIQPSSAYEVSSNTSRDPELGKLV